jgi:hypothetical protein
MTLAAQKTTPTTIIRYRGNVFAEPFPSNHKGNTHSEAPTDGRDLYGTPLRWVKTLKS